MHGTRQSDLRKKLQWTHADTRFGTQAALEALRRWPARALAYLGLFNGELVCEVH